MAEPEVVTDKEAKAPGKKPAKAAIIKVLLVVACVIAVLAAIFVASAQFSKMQRTEGAPTEPRGPSTGQTGEAITDAAAKTEDMGSFTSVITDESGRTYTLKMTVLLTVHSSRGDHEAAIAELKARKDQLIDGINEVIYGLDPSNFQGSPAQRLEGLSELKASIIRAVNARMKTKIDGVYLKDFIIQ